MKCLWKKVICGALVAGMLAQCPQSIYAEDAANTATVTDTESNHVTPDTTQQPDDTQQPGDIQQPDDTQQPEELPQPSAVEGLHTTKQGKTKVYLEWEESSDATSYVIYRKTAGGEYKNLPRGASHPIPIKTYHPVRHIHIKLLQKTSRRKRMRLQKSRFRIQRPYRSGHRSIHTAR